MQEYLIVDGYNIIGAWPELVKLKDVNLEEARDRLIHILAEYQGYSGFTIYLVFDAHQIPGLGKKYEYGKLKVHYTKEKETADELIERLVTRIAGRRRQIYVATSDMVEQHMIFGLGAYRLPANELLTKVEQNKREIRERIAERPADSKRNTFDSRLKPDLKDLFERMRRGK